MCVYQTSAGPTGDNVVRKLDFIRKQDGNANVILCICMRGKNKRPPLVLLSVGPPSPLPHANFNPSCFLSFFPLSPVVFPSILHQCLSIPPLPPAALPVTTSHAARSLLVILSLQKRKTTTISVEVKKSQHKYIIGPKGNTLQEILEATGVSVEMPPLDSGSETIILRGEPDKLGPALTQVYAKVRRRWEVGGGEKLTSVI